MSFPVVLSVVLLAIVLIVLLTSWLKHNTFLSMFIVALLLGIVILPAKDVVPVITQGFGDTMKSIGVIIVLGIMIGVLLEKTGATLSMAAAVLRVTGKQRAGLAIGITGLIVGIPIFCNSGFIMLSGLNKSLVQRSGKPMIYMATMLATGLYSIHCLIPPHPGAMAAVSLMKPNIGQLILLGITIAIPGAAAGFAWARFMCRNEPHSPVDAQSDEKLHPDERELPTPFRSFLPILVPLVLLTAKSIVTLRQTADGDIFENTISLLGCPEVALLIGVGLAVTLFKKIDTKLVSALFDDAIEKAGPILVLTGAGGIFGAVIKATGVGEHAGAHLAYTGLGLTIPFVISAFLKTAQGSSTVAIMTAASIMAPMLTALHLSTDAGRLLATLAMGAGSMVVSHANDSYFWVVAKFSGLESGPTLRVYTTTTLVMGLVTFLIILLCSFFML
jgi:gluconate:H+ symporter, GntP family